MYRTNPVFFYSIYMFFRTVALVFLEAIFGEDVIELVDQPVPGHFCQNGRGSDGNTQTLVTLRGALYGAGYHVLTMPSPTFPGFIVAASSTGVAGDLRQDARDLYAAMQQIIAHLPRNVQITDIDVLGYSLGGANAGVVKSIDATEGKLHIHRAVMINPPVSLFASVARIDKLFAITIGPSDAGIADWRYTAGTEQRNGLATLKQAGFKTLGCAWYEPENIRGWAQQAIQHGALGTLQTTWAG